METESNRASGEHGLLRRIGLSSRRAGRRPGFRDGYFADPARVEDDYLRLRRSHD